jgi:murein DD-endopeptidase MepM/ murein hydrolase activator NlpD
MSRRPVMSASLVAVLALLATACGRTDGASENVDGVASAAPTITTATPFVPEPSRPVTQPAPEPTTVIATPEARAFTDQLWTPFAGVGRITLRHPASRVELIGFHESNHEGAQQLSALPGAVRPRTLPTRGRLTTARTAADVVVDPAKQIRAPATGRVKRAGTYVLYCKYSDDYVVIEPDSHPGWEVKLLHVDHEIVNVGDHVTAGETIIAPRATKLPFASDVDEFTASPHWPHVHIEVVDPSIPNRPSPGSGC